MTNQISEEITIAEEVIQEYILNLREPSSYLRKPQKQQFANASYSVWAAREVLKCVKEQKSRHPVDVIEDFVRRMDQYSCMGSDHGYIFSIAHDIGLSILDLFL